MEEILLEDKNLKKEIPQLPTEELDSNVTIFEDDGRENKLLYLHTLRGLYDDNIISKREFEIRKKFMVDELTNSRLLGKFFF